jgi:prolipoprotein diacylglyceryltransferase
VPFAVVALDFDPVLRLGGLAVRLDTLVAAIGVLLALFAAAATARATPALRDEGTDEASLRLDDLLFVVLAAVPGALIGGRLGYALLHLDYYRANPGALLDPGRGSLELTLAVVGAGVSGVYGARMLSEPAGRWLHVAALPTLIALGVGKVSMALGGRGQGAPSSADWATRYVGDAGWRAVAPEVGSHPSQLYEALGIGVVALIVVALGAGGFFDRRNGLAWLVAVAGWATVRAAVATTWTDPAVLGPLRAGQLICLVVVLGSAAAGLWLSRRRARAVEAANAEPSWPDPGTRPRF